LLTKSFPKLTVLIVYKMMLLSTQDAVNTLKCITWEVQGDKIPRAPNHYDGAKWLRRHRKVPKVSKYFLQYSECASERSQVRTWGRQTCFLPRAPSNLATTLCTAIFLRNKRASHLVSSLPWACWLWCKKCAFSL